MAMKFLCCTLYTMKWSFTSYILHAVFDFQDENAIPIGVVHFHERILLSAWNVLMMKLNLHGMASWCKFDICDLKVGIKWSVQESILSSIYISPLQLSILLVLYNVMHYKSQKNSTVTLEPTWPYTIKQHFCDMQIRQNWPLDTLHVLVFYALQYMAQKYAVHKTCTWLT